MNLEIRTKGTYVGCLTANVKERRHLTASVDNARNNPEFPIKQPENPRRRPMPRREICAHTA
jgi:hypothetical protein